MYLGVSPKIITAKNSSCHVVRTRRIRSYLRRFNEAGVKSSISRAVKEEMIEGSVGGSSSSHDDEYKLNFIGSQNEHVTTADAPSSISVMDVLEYSLTAEGWVPRPTAWASSPHSAALFLVLVYIVFVKSDAPENLKDKMVERK